MVIGRETRFWARGRRSAIVTLVERKSGLLANGSVEGPLLTDDDSRRCPLPGRFTSFPASQHDFRQRSEFAEYETLTRELGLSVYFADPYCAWQRGSNENLNGLVRQFFRKGTDFKHVRRKEVKRVEQLINDRPRRRLNYRTPAEVINRKLCRN